MSTINPFKRLILFSYLSYFTSNAYFLTKHQIENRRQKQKTLAQKTLNLSDLNTYLLTKHLVSLGKARLPNLSVRRTMSCRCLRTRSTRGSPLTRASTVKMPWFRLVSTRVRTVVFWINSTSAWTNDSVVNHNARHIFTPENYIQNWLHFAKINPYIFNLLFYES